MTIGSGPNRNVVGESVAPDLLPFYTGWPPVLPPTVADSLLRPSGEPPSAAVSPSANLPPLPLEVLGTAASEGIVDLSCLALNWTEASHAEKTEATSPCMRTVLVLPACQLELLVQEG